MVSWNPLIFCSIDLNSTGSIQCFQLQSCSVVAALNRTQLRCLRRLTGLKRCPDILSLSMSFLDVESGHGLSYMNDK